MKSMKWLLFRIPSPLWGGLGRGKCSWLFQIHAYNHPFIKIFILVVIFPCSLGCASSPVQKNSPLKELSQNIQKDKQAQSAIESVTGAMISNHIAVRYCPVDGERFSPRVKVCPTHQVPLEEVEK